MRDQTTEQAAHQLMMSQTFHRLAQLAQGMPTDVNKPDDLKAALATCVFDVVAALDDDKIHFDNDENKAMLYGLLAVCADYVMGGRLSKVEAVRVN